MHLTPDLSVVIPSVNGSEILVECLEALHRNASNGVSLEVLVVERCGEHVRQVVADRFPDVTVLATSDGTSIPDMRALGVQHATGRAIAMIEDHILVPADWASRIQASLATGAAVVGGSVYNAATDTIVDWAAFFCEYSHLLMPRAGADVDRLSGNNVVYTRELGVRYSTLLREGRWEDHFHDELKRDGIKLMCAPEIAVGHKMHYRMKEYLSQRFLYSRAWSGVASLRLTTAQRMAGMAKSVVLPPVLFARIVGRVWATRRHRRELLESLPLLAVFVCAWAAGEGVGYATGPGNSLARVR